MTQVELLLKELQQSIPSVTHEHHATVHALEVELTNFANCLPSVRDTFLNLKSTPAQKLKAMSLMESRLRSLKDVIVEVRKARQENSTQFENFDQKANQLFQLISTVLKNMEEMQGGVTRNLI